ncbi:low affinity iron permease family protein [Flavihumibacter petaseus]|uniref:Low affinity iron permease family protein n=1 Tax=Flavihumibacter petaseus NBRC 106054 TaxID=1220578 RepID=A0A0E9N295_9BACT|nr:low affinity iron permease family protein [Flavihumibacter petaseus]GAO43440.1 hypothetical protein FPE01S_02_05450 [Flavihumibacter petaseus NBRC 106054]
MLLSLVEHHYRQVHIFPGSEHGMYFLWSKKSNMSLHAKQPSKPALLFDKIAGKITRAVGSPYAFIIATIIVIGWAITGPVAHYSETWQLIINTGTTIITFLMVFIIQQSQNKDTMAIQLKLNELIQAIEKADNKLIDIEDLTEEEIEAIKKKYIDLSDQA